MRIKDWATIRKGWDQKKLFEQALVRKSTMMICMSMGVKASAFNKAWPDPMNKKATSDRIVYKGVEMSKRQYQMLVKQREAHKKKTDV